MKQEVIIMSNKTVYVTEKGLQEMKDERLTLVVPKAEKAIDVDFCWFCI